MRLTFPHTIKAWTALAVGLITTAAIVWDEYGNLIPWDPAKISAIGTLLGAISVLLSPANKLTDKQIAYAQSLPSPPNGAIGLLDARGPNKFEPQTKAPPPYTEPPGRHPGESREHH